MAGFNLTIDQAKKQSACFLYVFVNFKVNGKLYLSYIDKKHRTIIAGKRANQQKLLMQSARAYLNKNAQLYGDEYNQYVSAIRSGFEETYGMSPEKALVLLAAGENVAGKNWNEGVYGVGALYNSTFNGVEINGQSVTVDPNTGHIYVGSKDVTDESKTVYKKIGKDTVAFQLFSTNGSASGYTTFMSQYNRLKKKYYAQSYSDDETRYDSNGKQISNSDAGSIFENVNFNWQSLLDWVINLINTLFGTNIPSTDTTDKITPQNTLLNQQQDGYVQESGMGEAAAILLALVAGGTLIAGGFGKNKKK